MLAASLIKRGIDVITTREPGGTPLGRQLRKAFLESDETVSPMAELLAFAADRAQHVDYLIRPALERGQIVISDRFADATFAYQGAGRGFSVEKVSQVIDLATGGLKPDLTLFLDIPVETACSRMAIRDGSQSTKNRMDEETPAFYARVRDAYHSIAQREPARFIVIDAAGPVEYIQKLIEEAVAPILGHPNSEDEQLEESARRVIS